MRGFKAFCFFFASFQAEQTIQVLVLPKLVSPAAQKPQNWLILAQYGRIEVGEPLGFVPFIN